MKNISNRLSGLEKAAAKTSLVNVELTNGQLSEMDLLKAVNLFLQGDVFKITRILKPGEQREYQSRLIQEIEEYINLEN